MILEIKHYPDPILKKKCKEVKNVNEQEKLIKDMFDTMYSNEGVGLSACQVGVAKQIAVVDIGEGPMVFINPIIVSKKGSIVSEEGCLSVPGVFLKIKRVKEIEIEALNEKGERFNIKAVGLLSRCFQQEMDHLNGILIIDRMPRVKKIKMKLLKKI